MLNKKFGNLLVKKQAVNNKFEQIQWLCFCDCGKTKIVTGCNLRSGNTKHCGCKNNNVKNLKSKKFGSLLPIDVVGRSKYQAALWLCKCDCGRETIVEGGNLMSGNTKSCGKCSFGTYFIKEGLAIGKFSKSGSFIIDAVDLPLVKKYRWWRESDGYFTTRLNGKCVSLHSILIGELDKGEVIDHIDRDKANNCRSNLRICTQKDNSRNRSKSSLNKSGYVGVCYHIRNHKYYASIKVNGYNMHIGVFDNKVDAAIARDKEAKKYFGEYAYLNFPEDCDANAI